MKILDATQYLLGDKRFVHVATVREDLRDYVCFRESEQFFYIRKITRPFPPKPQVYVEEIRPLTVNTFSVCAIDDNELWKAIVGLLIINGLIKENDLLEDYRDCVAVFNERLSRKLRENAEAKTKQT